MENYLFNQVASEYHSRLRFYRHKTVKVMTIISDIVLILSIIFWFVQKTNNELFPLFIVFIVIFIFVALITIMLSRTWISEKPLFEYLIPKVIEDISASGEATITYSPYPKEREFFENVGIFHKGVTKYLRYKMEYLSQNHFSTTIYDCYAYVSNGKTTTTMLDGLYYCFEIQNPQAFQLRSWGSPALKGIKFNKVDSSDKTKVYSEISIQKPIENKCFQIYQLMRASNPKGIQYLGGYKNQFDIAISQPKRFKRMKDLTPENYRLLKASILDNCIFAENVYTHLTEY